MGESSAGREDRRWQSKGVRSSGAAWCIIGLCACSWVGMARAVTFQYTGGAVASLNYNPQAANVPSAISFSITSSTDKVPANSQVELKLPGFTVCSGVCTAAALPRSLALQQTLGLGADATGIWDEDAKTLLLQVPSEVAEGAIIAGTIAVSAGMRLPRSGLLKDQTTLRYDDRANFKSPAVGSFALDLDSPNANDERIRLVYGAASGALSDVVKSGRPFVLKISFHNRMTIRDGEVVILTLPNFNGDSFSNADAKEAKVSDIGKFMASWDSVAFKLELRYVRTTNDLAPGFQEDIQVPGLKLPSDGVASNDLSLTIETNAALGPVSAIPIDLSPFVKGVITATSLSFCDGTCTFNRFEWLCVTHRAHPAQSAEMTFTFDFDADIAAGETIVLFLPGFGGASVDAIPISGNPLCDVGSNPPLHSSTVAMEQHPYGCTSNDMCQTLQYTGSGVLNRASWSFADQELTLTAARAASMGTQHVVSVPMDAGISLPATGIRTNTTDIKLRSKCVAGPIPPASPRSILGVGALQNVSLEFTPALPGQATEIAFFFTPVVDLDIGDVLELMLLDLNDDTVSEGLVAVTSSPAAFTSGASWSRESNALFLTCTQRSTAATGITVTVPAAFGLRLPLEGVGPNSGHHFYALQATHGYIPKMRIVETPRCAWSQRRVPAKLRFNNLVEGYINSNNEDGRNPPAFPGINAATRVGLKITPDRDIRENSILAITLPAFVSDIAYLPFSNTAEPPSPLAPTGGNKLLQDVYQVDGSITYSLNVSNSTVISTEHGCKCDADGAVKTPRNKYRVTRSAFGSDAVNFTSTGWAADVITNFPHPSTRNISIPAKSCGECACSDAGLPSTPATIYNTTGNCTSCACDASGVSSHVAPWQVWPQPGEPASVVTGICSNCTCSDAGVISTGNGNCSKCMCTPQVCKCACPLFRKCECGCELYESYKCGCRQTTASEIFSTALWNTTDQVLLLTVNKQKMLKKGVPETLWISKETGIKTPLTVQEFDKGQEKLNLKPRESCRPFDSAALWGCAGEVRLQITAVPPVLDSTIVTYGASLGFGFSDLTFQFTAKRGLAVGDIITLSLSGFSGEASEALAGSASASVTSKVRQPDSTFQAGSYVKSYAWHPGANSTLQVVLSAPIAIDTSIQIIFAQTSKIALPVFGIAANSKLLTVQASFDNGQTMSAIPIATSPMVSAILSCASLAFGRVRAHALANITLTLVPGFSEGFKMGDTISVHLPDFSFTSSFTTVSSALGSDTNFNQATWAENVVTLTVNTAFTEEVSVNLTVDAGIKLAAAGVRPGNKIPTIQGSVDGMGSFYFSAIPQVQTVGALQGDPQPPNLLFGGPNPVVSTLAIAGEPTSIDLDFAAHMVLHAGDTVTLTLTDFNGVNTNRVDVTSTPLNAVRRASWEPSSGRLVFTVGSITPIPALTRIQVGLPTSIARMPVLGLARCRGGLDSPSCPISVSVLAMEGDILTTPKTWMYDYEPVAMLPSSSFRCVPPTPGEFARVEVGFSSSQMLRPGDTMSIQLGTFMLQKTATNGYIQYGVVSSDVTGSSVFDTAKISEYDGQDLLVVLVATRDAVAGQKQLIIIPLSAGIVIPQRGIPTEDATKLEVNINAEAGGVSKVPISQVDRIGAMLSASFSLDPPSAGYVSEFSILFTPTMSLKPGEYFNFHLPGFTGPAESVVSVMMKECNPLAGSCDLECDPAESLCPGYAPVSYINQIRWTLDTESFNATISQTIPANAVLILIVGRDAKIAIPGSGIPATSRYTTMSVSAFARNGEIFRQYIEFPTFIPAVLSVKSFQVLPKRADIPAEIILTLQARLQLNIGTTILVYMPDFTGGRTCWNALPGDPRLNLRCLTERRSEVCGTTETGVCGPDVHRYCLPFSPYLNAFLKRLVGGCTLKPRLYIRPHNDPVVSKKVGLCDCLQGAEYQAMYDRIEGYWNITGSGIDGYRLPARYASQCWPWDSQTLSRTSVDCRKLLRGQDGPHCCSSFCFVKENCATAVAWHGYESSWKGLTAPISYDTCEDKEQIVEECPYSFPEEGRENLLTGSWTEFDSYLVLTLTQPIVAFSPITVTVPIEAGIHTPKVGLGESFTELDVDIWDVQANTRMEPLSADILGTIGAFLDSTLSVEELSAGMAVPITIQFTPLMRIIAGEKVEFVLTGFEFDSVSISLTSDPQKFSLSNWNARTETLSMVASSNIEKNEEIILYIPRALRLPVTGLSSASVIWILTNAASGLVPRESPFPVRILQKVGALWNTAVSFIPPVFNESMNVTLEFRSRMELVANEKVLLTMEGFTGPRTLPGESKYVATTFSEPAETFSVAWQNDGTAHPTLILIINNEQKLPADTNFRVVIPGNCTFMNALLQCTDEEGIARPSPQGEYDPKGLYLTVEALAGSLDKALIRVSSVLSERPTLNALRGTWKGVSHSASGFAQEANETHLLNCLSSGFQCPSKAAYFCETIVSETDLIIEPGDAGFKARLTTVAGVREIEKFGLTFEGAERGGDFELIEMEGNNLILKNVTASEYLIPDDPSREVDTSGTKFCSYARAVFRVDLDGTQDVAMELYTEYVYRSLNTQSTNVRLRLGIAADPYFNPVGLELHDMDFRKLFQQRLANTWNVGINSVVFSSSGRYPSVLKCKQLPVCNVELFVYAETEWQKNNGKLWARDIFEAISGGRLKLQMEMANFILDIDLKEPLYISPDTHVSTKCPDQPRGRISQPFAKWLSRGRELEVLDSKYGYATKDSATCERRRGADDSDQIAYGTGYTVNFGVISILTRESTNAEIPSFDANGATNVTRMEFGNVTVDESAAVPHLQSRPRVLLFTCFLSLFICACVEL